jgi:hypothetical protein
MADLRAMRSCSDPVIAAFDGDWRAVVEEAGFALSMGWRFNGAKGHFQMILASAFPRAVALAAVLVFAFTACPARADHCDDIAKQLAETIDGLKVGFKAANIIYLSHPAAAELSLGCRSSQYANELYAKTNRKIRPAFYALVGSAAAVIFSLPKDDTMTGTARCLRRPGLLHSKINMRYRRLDMECTRTKTEASIAVRRGLDQ